MKNIELTVEHKSKLLEMCKELFPEYTTIPNNTNPKFLTITWFTKLGYFVHLMDDNLKENELIHWFEFCMTHLCTKLFSELKLYLKLDIASYRGRIIQYEEHPIDYLYEEFKKLK